MSDQRSAKLKIAAVSTALFILSAFAILLLTDESIREDLDRLFVYTATVLVAFVVLNVLLVIVVLRASKKLKNKIEMKKCVSCSSMIPNDAEACPKCRAVQPLVIPEDAYLTPRQENEKQVKPKK
jgi:cytochrome bd-type quinol oxidase subunit 2